MAQPIIGPNDQILVTGAAGFVGPRIVRTLLDRGFRSIRCLVRPWSDLDRLKGALEDKAGISGVEIVKGNLLSGDDAVTAARGASVIYHLAAGTGTKSFADAFANSVVATRNLLEAARQNRDLRRFVNVSSFAVYTNDNPAQPGLLDESCPMETQPHERGDAYCYAKVKQDELVSEYGRKYNLPYVLVRPGVVYGPGKSRIHGRIGIDTFGIFFHLGGSNPVPLTFVDNCAEAIALAGLVEGIDGEVFNVVDDNLPSSREFLKLFKQHVRSFTSVYVPHFASYLLCAMWEKYAEWSQGQLPPVYNRRQWRTSWKRTIYSNAKIKARLGWQPKVSTEEGLRRFFESFEKSVYA